MFQKTLQNKRGLFCHKNDLLHPAQFGFRSQISRTDAITTIIMFMENERDEKHQEACFLNLRKAFDTTYRETF